MRKSRGSPRAGASAHKLHANGTTNKKRKQGEEEGQRTGRKAAGMRAGKRRRPKKKKECRSQSEK